MSSSQVRVESSSVKAKDVSNGTQYLIDIQVTVELVGEWSDWGYCKIRLTLFLSKAFSFLINCLQWTQGTIPDIPAGDKSSSGSSSSSSSRRQLSLSSRDSDDDNDDDEEPSIESGMNLLGPTAMLRKAVLSHKERLRAATASMSGFLRQTRHLVAELSDRPKGDTARTSFPSRTLLQTSAGDDGSCGGSVNASQVPGANSSIASFSTPTTNCSIQPITSETVIMANILGAVASTASAIKAIQVCFVCTGDKLSVNECWFAIVQMRVQSSMSQDRKSPGPFAYEENLWSRGQSGELATLSPYNNHIFSLQASEAGILSVVSSINDVFDGTDQKYKEHIASMNEWVVGLYTDLSQGLQVNEGMYSPLDHSLPLNLLAEFCKRSWHTNHGTR